MRNIKFIETPAFLLMILAVACLGIAFFLSGNLSGYEITITEKYINCVTKNYPKNHAIKNAEYKQKFVKIIDEQVDKYHFEPSLLIAIIHLESKFTADIKGDSGTSHGSMQCKKQAIIKCKCKDVYTVDGGVKCGSCWLNKGAEWCQTLDGAMNAFVHGTCKATKTSDVKKVKKRFDLAEDLKQNCR